MFSSVDSRGANIIYAFVQPEIRQMGPLPELLYMPFCQHHADDADSYVSQPARSLSEAVPHVFTVYQ
jgi:hypothetical protein